MCFVFQYYLLLCLFFCSNGFIVILANWPFHFSVFGSIDKSNLVNIFAMAISTEQIFVGFLDPFVHVFLFYHFISLIFLSHNSAPFEWVLCITGGPVSPDGYIVFSSYFINGYGSTTSF